MNLHIAARLLLALFCAIQGIATVVLDLNRTQATHPQWLGHARFHVVWQTGTVAFLSVLEVLLLCVRGPSMTERFYLAAILACLPMFGFFAALFARRLYGGTLSDPDGIPPWTTSFRGYTVRIDLNLAAVIAGIITVAILVALFRFSSPLPHAII